MILVCLSLLVSGFAFLIAGFQINLSIFDHDSYINKGLVDYFNDNYYRGISFITFGTFMFIPGSYYTRKLYEAWQAGLIYFNLTIVFQL